MYSILPIVRNKYHFSYKKPRITLKYRYLSTVRGPVYAHRLPVIEGDLVPSHVAQWLCWHSAGRCVSGCRLKARERHSQSGRFCTRRYHASSRVTCEHLVALQCIGTVAGKRIIGRELALGDEVGVGPYSVLGVIRKVSPVENAYRK